MSEFLFNTNAAADYLHEHLPDKPAAYWNTRLINMRRTDRQQPITMEFSTIGKGVFYVQAELDRFVEFERGKRIGKVKLPGRAVEALRAFGIGEQSGSAFGRIFKGGSANPHSDNQGGAFVQAIVQEPLIVFAMTAEQAIAFGEELVKAGRQVQRINQQKGSV